MQRISTVKHLFLTGAAGLTCGLVTLASAAAHARTLDTLQSYDPTLEAVAPADVGFAASCRAAARDLLGRGDYTFGRPAYTVRDGQSIVRMDVAARGAPRDPANVSRAVCVRAPQATAVEAMIFDAPANDVGPRVIVLAGPEGGTNARAAKPDHTIVSIPDPDDGSAYDDGYVGNLTGYVGGFAGAWPSTFGKHHHRVPSATLGPSAVHKSPRFVVRTDRGVVLRTDQGIVVRTKHGFGSKPIRGFAARPKVGFKTFLPPATVRLSTGLPPATVRLSTGAFIR